MESAPHFAATPIFSCPRARLGTSDVVRFTFARGGQAVGGFVTLSSAGPVAYEDRCPHWGTSLAGGDPRRPGYDASGTWLVCHTHAARFEAHDGQCVAGPCEGQALTRLRVECREDVVHVFDRAAFGVTTVAGMRPPRTSEDV